jgi:phage-related protein
MVNIFSGIKDTFANIGKNVIEGIKSGISGAVSGLYDSIKSSLSGLVSTAKSALGIASPSKVFKEQIGKFIPSGVAAGIEDNEETLTSSIGNMANRAVGAAQTAIEKINPSLGSTIVTGVPGVTSGDTNSSVTTVNNTVTIQTDSVDEENIGSICDEINRRLGLAY